MTAIIVTAIFEPRPGASAGLRSALQQAIPAVHAEAGCELYAIHDAEDGSIVMLEKWTTQEDLKAHADGQAVVELNALIAPHLASPVRVTAMSPILAGTPAQGAL